jgi:hypothetical protein
MEASAMADLDWGHFAHALRGALDSKGLGRNAAASAWPSTNTAMLSRAMAGERLSAGNFILLCGLAGLDPFEFLQVAKQRRVTLAGIRKSLADQTGTEGVTRETRT